MGRPKRTAEENAVFIEKIVTIAEELFYEEGYESVSMRRIAKKAGCSPMKIYSYFDSKQSILRCIWDTIFDDVHTVCLVEFNKEGSPPEKLKRVCRAFLDFWLKHPEYFEVVYMTIDPGAVAMGHDIYNAHESSVKKIYGLVRNTLEEGKSDSTFIEVDTDIMLQTLFSSMYGVLLCLITIPEYDWLPNDQLCEESLDAFLRAYSRS